MHVIKTCPTLCMVRMAVAISPEEETAMSVALAAEIADALVTHGLVESSEDTVV